ncbi:MULTISPECIES: MFS transporter [Nocardiaceae]|uniref:DHA1 family inner membrane transport protein n=1 Tax=Rhodococcoides corynebacterioides TaxID=53972 RepID=A0ABS2KZJ4_9NOCA|nr:MULTISPECIES: MFS transporter [Rhodococcus]MBM7417355.1 DHA1 family inner membrane transport protein [Rhodococcus corynebacterioides]MBP1115608.1 DHA1 family inner membrane transport protein [Rhodococcus sp. PvP016]
MRPGARGLAALALGTFAIGTSEFFVMGMVTVLSDSLHVSVAAVGSLVTAYAVGVAVGAPAMIVALNRVPRRRALEVLLALFVLSHVVAAFAPTFEWLVVLRFVGGLPHGAFFGLAAVVGTTLVPASSHGRAIATILVGVTLANVVGVPAATALAQNVGWRPAFAVVAMMGGAALMAVRHAIPGRLDLPMPSLRAEFAGLLNRHSLLTIATVAVGFSGLFTVYAFIDPLMTRHVGLSSHLLPWVFAIVGVGFTVGTIVGGWATDRSVRWALTGGLAVLAISLTALGFVGGSAWGAILVLFVIGAASFAAETPVQKRLIDQAPDAPTVASATNQSAFNAANAIGAGLGGVIVGSGWSLSALGPMGGACAGVGLILALVSFTTDGDPGGRARASSTSLSPLG